MKNKLQAILILIGLTASFAAWSQMTLPPSGNNQKSEVTQYMGLVKATIVYSSPDVAGRPIYNTDIVPYGLKNLQFAKSTDANPSPWRAGANENTTITFSNDVTVEGQALKAGTYGVHMIPGADEWTIIFSNNSTSWGSFFYTPAEDALRVKVKPVACEFNEFLTYEFTDRLQNSSTARMKWEKVAVPFKIAVPNGDDLYVKKVREEITTNKGFNWLNVVSAANYMANKKTNLDEAMEWLNSFTNPPRNVKYFPILNAKGNVFKAMGKQAEADAVMKEAINLPDATIGQIANYGRSLIKDRPKDAMVVLEAGYKRYPTSSVALMGMARGYNANGDNKKALKFAQDALKAETDPAAKTAIEGMVKKLEKGETINQ
jgi:hypothetical protein